MRNIERTIDEVRRLRGDLSTWLVHLTKGNFFTPRGQTVWYSPKESLESILRTDVLAAVKPVGQFNYRKWYKTVNHEDLKAVSFTETPLNEIFLFINIKNKAVKFSSYGLVFDRDELSKSPFFAAPVLYFSQPEGDSHYLDVFSKLEQMHCGEYSNVLFLFDKFGKTFSQTDYNFMWEREWRLKGHLKEVTKYLKFGLCPEEDIGDLEAKFAGITFVDPFFTPKQIEAKLKDRGILS